MIVRRVFPSAWWKQAVDLDSEQRHGHRCSMSIDLTEPASVQYSEWRGTFAADDVDMGHLEDFFGIDRKVWRIIVVDITIYGGTQEAIAYGVPNQIGYAEIEALHAAGSPLPMKIIGTIDYDPDTDRDDTNPPRPLSMPAISATELLGHAFKRLQLRFTTAHLPNGIQFEVDETDPREEED